MYGDISRVNYNKIGEVYNVTMVRVKGWVGGFTK